MNDRPEKPPRALPPGRIVQPTENPLAVTTDELEYVFNEIVQVLQNGDELHRRSVAVFVTTPRTNWQNSDVLKVLDLLEKSTLSHAAKDRLILLQSDIIRRLISGQERPFIGPETDGAGIVGEVEYIRETVRSRIRFSSVSPSVSTDARRLTVDRFASDSADRLTSVSASDYRPFDNVDSGHALPRETDAERPKRTAKTGGKQRKEYVNDARQRADKYLRRSKGGIALSAQQLADRLGISKTVAAEALKAARNVLNDQSTD